MFQPIAFEAQNGQTIKLHVNGFAEGFKTLCWYRKDKPDHVEIEELGIPDYTVEYLHEGDYVFYTMDGDHHKSETMTVYLHEDYSSDIIADIQQKSSDLSDTEYNKNFQVNLANAIFKGQTVPALFCLGDMYRELKDPEPFERNPYELLAPYLEKKENRTIQSMNRNGLASEVLLSDDPMPILTTGNEITKIVIFTVHKGKEKYLRTIDCSLENSVQLELKEKTNYLIRIYAHDDYVTCFHHLQLDSAILAPIWGDIKAKRAARTDVQDDETLDLSDDATVLFDEDEQKLYAEERGISSNTPVFPRLELTNEIDGDIDVHIPYISILNQFKQRLCLSSKDTDFLDEPGFSTTISLKEGEYQSVNPRERDSYCKQLFCLTSRDGKVLSPVERYDETEDLEEYKEKRRLYELDVYAKQLSSSYGSMYTEAVNYLKNLIQAAKEESSINAGNIVDYLVMETFLSPLPYQIDDIVYAILRNHFVNMDYDPAFFESNKVIAHQGIRRLSFEPQQRDYVLVVEHVPTDAEEVDYDAFSSSIGSIDVSMNDHGLYFMYAIAEDDFRVSGFAMVDVDRDYWKTWNLELDVH